MSQKIDMQYTENPYVDVLIYNVKKLAMDTVLKMKDNADKNETLTSKKNADLFMSCMDGSILFELFEYFPEEVLRRSGITGSMLLACLADPSKVPDTHKDAVFENMKAYVIANYEEKNDYYRMLYGLPPMEYTEVYVTGWEPPEDLEIDLSIPIHEMSYDALSHLRRYGVLDRMYDEDPKNRAYFKYLFKKIHPYAARKADNFQTLYVPEIDSAEIKNEYTTRLAINREYALRTVYSSAYKLDSDYYDNFIAVFIVLMTMVDIIARVQEFIARKEVFDARTVRYIFESNGVTYFPEIPLKYQIKMVKNLHTLLKYKSSAKCMVDICELFGFKNIQVFKYYLLRSRHYSKPTDTYSFSGDDAVDFSMRFVKIPIDGNMEDYIRDSSYAVDYDEVVSGDPTWDAEKDHDTVKEEHLSGMDYNYTRTKYISVDSLYDIAKMSIQQSYFFNMLYDNIKLESQIKVGIPYIDTSKDFNIADIFTFLTCLTYQYNNMKDFIMDTVGKVISIKGEDTWHSKTYYNDADGILGPGTVIGKSVMGFDFKANLEELAAHMTELLGQDPDDYNPHSSETVLAKAERDAVIEVYQKFNIPTDSIPSMKQLMNLFTNNLDVYKLVIAGMRNASNKNIYDAYKLIYDSLMEVELTLDYFKNPDTNDFYRDIDGNATYTEYLRHKDPILYDKLMEIQMMDDDENRIQYIANLIDNIVYILEEWIDTEEFAGIFANLPVVSTEAVKQYIMTVINFYKSYKVHFLGINTMYILDDKYDQWVKIIDDYALHRFFVKDDIMAINENIYRMWVEMSKKEKVELIERVYLDISTWKYQDWVQPYKPNDIPRFISHLNPYDILITDEDYSIRSAIYEDDSFRPQDIKQTASIFMEKFDEGFKPHDDIRINVFNET